MNLRKNKANVRSLFDKHPEGLAVRVKMIQYAILVLVATLTAWPASLLAVAKLSSNDPLSFGFTPIPLVSPLNFSRYTLEEQKKKDLIKHFCKRIKLYFRKYGWNEEPCGDVPWQANLISKNGSPLIYASFGKGEEATLLLGGVHPDELTPIPIAFRTARHLAQHPELYQNQGVVVIVAPLVNPDGFLRNTANRTNANGIDLNRNFFTLDWYDKALNLWQNRRKRDRRHFPGYFPNSEIETLFQIQLMDHHKPDKILSIHAPLGFLDYDGPGDRKPRMLSPTEKRAKQLVHSISKKSKNYRVVDYNFYPGSLGNYAGNERHVPTVTLELETTDPKQLDAYWEQFLPGILQSIHYPFSKNPDPDGAKDASPFSVGYEEPEAQTI